MTDEQIEALKAMIADGNVYWKSNNEIRKCVGVNRNWIEIFHDGSKADIAEPVVIFDDGTVAALWVCECTEFIRVDPCFSPDGTSEKTEIENLRSQLYVMADMAAKYVLERNQRETSERLRESSTLDDTRVENGNNREDAAASDSAP